MSDAGRIAERMRSWDRYECLLFGHDPDTYLHGMVRMGGTLVLVLDDDTPIAIGSVTPSGIAPEIGIAWILGTNEISSNPRQFLRATRHWLDTFTAGYAEVRNVIPAKRVNSIRWLQSMGFDFGPAFLHYSNEVMREFSYRRGTARRTPVVPQA